MLKVISKKRIRKMSRNSVGNVSGLYIGDYYVKDFKYISPGVLASTTKVEEKTVVEKWFSEVVKGLKQFFYGGSLHGVKYIFEPTFGIKERIIWIIIVLISIAVCAVNIIQLFCKWTSTPFVNVIDSAPSPIWAVPFPTVVLCPHLHMKLSYRNVSEMDDMEQFYASLVCPLMLNRKSTEHPLNSDQIRLLHEFIVKVAQLTHMNTSRKRPQDAMLMSCARYHQLSGHASLVNNKEASPTCDEVIKTCNWPAIHFGEWETKNCCQLFQPIFTNYGLCFAFNSLPLNGMTNATLPWQRSFNQKASPAALQWDLDHGYPKTFPLDPMVHPFRATASGEANGLGLELYLNTSDHQYLCEGKSLGFTVLVSSPTDHVYTSTVLRLPMDRMTTVEVSPLTYKTDPSLRALPPSQRQCYFQDERSLQHYRFYTDSNCKHDMLLRQAREDCDCVLFNWPKKQLYEPICSTKKEFDCIEQVKAKVDEQLINAYFAESDEMMYTEDSVSCHPSCNDVMYTSQVFYSDLAQEVAGHRSGQPNSGELTQINVHFYDDIFLGQHRHAQYDKYYFAGAIGGLLSLFLGFSIISVAEIIYFVILKPVFIVLKQL